MSRSSGFALFFVVFVAFFDTFAVASVMARYTEELQAPRWLSGLIFGSYSLANLLASLATGYIIDRFGRKRPMVASLAVTSLVLLLYAVISTPFALLAVRFLHGAAGAVFIPALFALASETVPRKREGTVSFVGVTIGLVPLVAFPVAGAMAQRSGEPALFLLIGGLMAVGAVTAAVGLRDTQADEPQTSSLHPARALAQPGVQRVMIATFGLTCGMGVLTYWMPLMAAPLGVNKEESGRLFTVFAIAAIAVMAGVRRVPAGHRLMGGVATLAAGLLALQWLPGTGGIAAAMAVCGVGFGLAFPALNLLAYDAAPQGLHGTALALVWGCYSLGYFVGPSAAGQFAQTVPPPLLGAAFGLAALALAGLRSVPTPSSVRR